MDHGCQPSVPWERPEESCSPQDAQDPCVGWLLRDRGELAQCCLQKEPRVKQKIKMPKIDSRGSCLSDMVSRNGEA